MPTLYAPRPAPSRYYLQYTPLCRGLTGADTGEYREDYGERHVDRGTPAVELSSAFGVKVAVS